MRRHTFISRLPLRRKLMLIIMGTSMLGLLLAAGFFGLYERYRVRLSMVHDLAALSQLIGGEDYIGQGWRMLVECLSVGRAITLPSTASGNGRVVRLKGVVTRCAKRSGTVAIRSECPSTSPSAT